MDNSSTALLVIDVQERFRCAMADFHSMMAGCARLIRTFHALELPILVTEQYPRGLGHTVPELKELLGEIDIPAKTSFSSWGCSSVPEHLAQSKARAVLVCGIETHVCVNQTVHDLLAADLEVQVAVDAVLSRKRLDHDFALRRMERSGAILTTTEAAAFELLVDAGHPRFKEVQGLFK